MRHFFPATAMTLAVVLSSALAAPAQETGETETVQQEAAFSEDHLALAETFIRQTFPRAAVVGLVNQVLERETQIVRQARPNLSTNALNLFRQGLQEELREELDDLRAELAKIWAGSFTKRELEEVLAFLDTSAGEKLFRTQPKLLNESLKVGQNWSNGSGRDAALRVRQRLRQRGIDI